MIEGGRHGNSSDASAGSNQDVSKELIEETVRLRLRVAELEKQLQAPTTAESVICRLTQGSDQASFKSGVGQFGVCPSLAEKHKLLKLASESLSPEVQLAASLFVKDSVTFPLFCSLARAHPDVKDVALVYFHRRENWHELEQFALFSGNLEDIALNRFRQALHDSSEHSMASLAQWCAQRKGLPWVDLVRFACDKIPDLNKRIDSIEQHDSLQERMGLEPLYRKYGRVPISGTSPASLLKYCSFFHHNVTDETKHSCCKAIISHQVLSKPCALWQRLLSRSKIGDWAAVKELSIDKGLILTTTESCIGFHPFVDQITGNHGPDDLALHFLKMVKDPSLLYRAAIKTRCFDSALDALLSMDGWKVYSRSYSAEHALIQPWLTEEITAVMMSGKDLDKPTAQRLRKLEDAKCLIDEALQMRPGFHVPDRHMPEIETTTWLLQNRVVQSLVD